ncbi:hypothetical protein B0H63DRAFT_291568 [Podospora didyma]|uniref:Uncharacterized protein n=1 Tax=Podospora didyma TaxID=330526 RepID=A0AAE0K9U9_9PEZI|nr:hypothetical protein B0H63DRAFT_291568 [Podospora didyma]
MVTLKSMRKERVIAAMEKRLSKYQLLILLRLTVMLKDQQGSIGTQLDQLESKVSRLSAENALRISRLKSDLIGDIKRLVDQKKVSGSATGVSVVSTTYDPGSGLTNLRSAIDTLASGVVSATREDTILNNLFFESVYLREESGCRTRNL